MTISDQLFEAAHRRFITTSLDEEIDLRIQCDRQVDLALQGGASPRFADMLEAIAAL